MRKDQDLPPPPPDSYDEDEIETDLAALEEELKERYQDSQYESLQDDESKGLTTGQSLCFLTDCQKQNFLI